MYALGLETLKVFSQKEDFRAHVVGIFSELENKYEITFDEIIQWLKEDDLYKSTYPCSIKAFRGKYVFLNSMILPGDHVRLDADTIKMWVLCYTNTNPLVFGFRSFINCLEEDFDLTVSIFSEILRNST